MIKLQSDYSNAYFQRGLAYVAENQLDEAIADFTQTIELKSGYVEAYYYRGVAYGEKCQYDYAIADIKKVIVFPPGISVRKTLYIYDHMG